MSTTGDLRVRRTHKLIRDAFISLLEERGFDSITVGDIATRAMVSRTAFYRYYEDKYMLAERIFEDVLVALVEEVDPLRIDLVHNLEAQPVGDPWRQLFGEVADSIHDPEPLVRFFSHFGEHERMYRAVLGEKGNSWFAAKMHTYFASKIQARLNELAYMLHKTSVTDKPAFAKGLVGTIVAGQIIDMIRWWLANEKPLTADQIGRYCWSLICATLKDAATWE